MKRVGLILGFLLVSFVGFGQNVKFSKEFLNALKSRQATLVLVPKILEYQDKSHPVFHLTQVDNVKKTTTSIGVTNNISNLEVYIMFDNHYVTAEPQPHDKPRVIRYFITPLKDGYFYYWFESEYVKETMPVYTFK
jgi:hypothetical protein